MLFKIYNFVFKIIWIKDNFCRNHWKLLFGEHGNCMCYYRNMPESVWVCAGVREKSDFACVQCQTLSFIRNRWVALSFPALPPGFKSVHNPDSHTDTETHTMLLRSFTLCDVSVCNNEKWVTVKISIMVLYLSQQSSHSCT